MKTLRSTIVIDMKQQTYQKIVNAVVMDSELSDKQQKEILLLVLDKTGLEDKMLSKEYMIFCNTCKKPLLELPIKFLVAKKLQMKHKTKRERYATHSDTYGHDVELIEAKDFKNHWSQRKC